MTAPEGTNESNNSLQQQQPQQEEPQNLVETVQSYLTQQGLSFDKVPTRTTPPSTIFKFSLTGNYATYKVYIDVKSPPQSRLIVYIETPVKVPPAQRAVACEYWHRVNYCLGLGHVELDFRDGEVRYRLGLDVEGSFVSSTMLQTYIMASAGTVDRFFPGHMACVFGRASPEEQLVRCRDGPVGRVLQNDGNATNAVTATTTTTTTTSTEEPNMAVEMQ